jgi:hypothetical protein
LDESDLRRPERIKMSFESICLAQHSMLVEEALIGPVPFFSRTDVGDGSFATELGRPRHVRSEPLLTRVLDAPQAVVSRLRDGRRWMIVRPREK